MVRHFEATLSTTEVLVLGVAHHVPVRRFPLTFPSLSADPQRLVQVGLTVAEDLENRRLSRRGRLNRDLARCFELFADHTVSIGVSGIDGTDADFFFLGLTDHRDQLVVTQHGDDLAFDLDDRDDLPAKIVPLFDYGWSAPDDPVMRMPLPAPGAHRGSTTTPEPRDTRIQEVVRPPERGFEHARHRPSPAQVIAAIPTFERFGGGFIAIDGRTRTGGRVHAPPLSWIDTDVGRYLVTIDDNDTGDMVFTSADAAILTRTLHEHSRDLWNRVR